MPTQEEIITGLEKQVGDLSKKLDEAIKSGGGVKIAALTKELETATATLKAATEETERLKAENAELTEKAKMTPEQKAAFDAMKDEDKKKFLALKPEERQKRVDEIKKGDESVVVEGQTIYKSKVGPEQFAIFKSMSDKIAKQEADIAKEREDRQTVELTKRAETELHHMPGEVSKKVDVLKALAGMPEEARKTLDTMLKAGNAAIKAGFDRIGSGAGTDPEKTKSAKSFEDSVQKIQDAEKCSKTVALQKARVQNPEGFKAYQELGAAQN